MSNYEVAITGSFKTKISIDSKDAKTATETALRMLYNYNDCYEDIDFDFDHSNIEVSEDMV